MAVSSFDPSEVTSDGVRAQAFAYHLITNLLIHSCSVSEFAGLGFLSQSSNKLFDSFVWQLTCFTKKKPFIRNIRLGFEIFIQGRLCFVIAI